MGELLAREMTSNRFLPSIVLLLLSNDSSAVCMCVGVCGDNDNEMEENNMRHWHCRGRRHNGCSQ